MKHTPIKTPNINEKGLELLEIAQSKPVISVKINGMYVQVDEKKFKKFKTIEAYKEHYLKILKKYERL